jgi:hypothetical protein
MPILVLGAIALAAVAVGSMSRANNDIPAYVHAKFNDWSKKHGKVYASPVEKYFRMGVFYKNYLRVAMTNSKNGSFTFGLNKFSDMTEKEFKAKYLGFRKVKATNSQKFTADMVSDVPSSKDWNAEGVVTPVKNQGQCGSCWAFATTGALEGAWKLAGHDLTSFSEQQLVDCSGSYGNMGCNGGLPDLAFEYIISNGLTTEDQYKYTARDGHCTYKVGQKVLGASSYTDVKATQTDLKAAVAQTPIAIGIYAIPWMSYTGGIYDDIDSCPSSEQLLDHGVLVTGYGSQDG